MAQQKLFEIDPVSLPGNVRMLKEYEHPTFHDPIRIYLVDSNVLVVQGESTYPDGDVVKDQLELPAEAIAWLVDSIESRFWKAPSDGGLPRNVLHDMATIDSERIKINRGVSIGGEGIGGFRIVNLDRLDYGKWPRSQEFGFTDVELVDMALLEFFKDFAQRHASGQI